MRATHRPVGTLFLVVRFAMLSTLDRMKMFEIGPEGMSPAGFDDRSTDAGDDDDCASTVFDGEGGHEEFTNEMLSTLTFLSVKVCQTCCHSRLALIPRCFYYLAKGFLPCVRKQSQRKTIHTRQLNSKKHNSKTTQHAHSQQLTSRAKTTANANATPFHSNNNTDQTSKQQHSQTQRNTR